MFLIEKYLNYYYTEKNFMLTGNAVRMQFCNLERFPTKFEWYFCHSICELERLGVECRYSQKQAIESAVKA